MSATNGRHGTILLLDFFGFRQRQNSTTMTCVLVVKLVVNEVNRTGYYSGAGSSEHTASDLSMV